MITAHQAKYLAYQLTKRYPSNSYEKFSEALSNAQVDLNPHQVEAAYFAFQSPLSSGAILADEVGLGKTIEAGILLSQKWAERKRKILIIDPSNLRKQWSQELLEKFFLPTLILEKSSFNQEIKKRNLNPFDQQENIVITSYHFAKSNTPYIEAIKWDLIVVDEAHRLRNVYKPQSKIANIIKEAIVPFNKILLTATPLQNSLLELFGLVSIIDEYAFGDLKSFKEQYTKFDPETGNFEDLKQRIKPICHRTLRKQVQEYVKYTSRRAIVQQFVPNPDEQLLYEHITEFLRREDLYSLPVSQRQLLTLILLKLQASSTFAIAPTFEKLMHKLEEMKKIIHQLQTDEQVEIDLTEYYDNFQNVRDEWIDEEEEDEEDGAPRRKKQLELSPADLPAIELEMQALMEMQTLALSVKRNSKGDNLLGALNKGFQEIEKIGANKKAIIFTESTRTQRYVQELLEHSEYKGKTVLFNGTNSDSQSTAIYQKWLKKHAGTDMITGSKTADRRAAIVEYFKEDATIMIATEAAAEGINLQFCSLICNFDLPWNPQRIEQRIGRCHRYGQKHDVVVVNFLNQKNEADQRVYELLDQKFKLFDGVFGSSDEVLGSIESGVDLERRIVDIYKSCRTESEIDIAFKQLQLELEPEIEDKMQRARQTLFENFDDEVHQKLKISLDKSKEFLSRYEKRLWQLTKYQLNAVADFNDENLSFELHNNPFLDIDADKGPYRMAKHVEDGHTYRVGHPLAQKVIDVAKAFETEAAIIEFNCSGQRPKISALDSLIGQTGWLAVSQLSIQSFEAEDELILVGITDEGKVLDRDLCEKLLLVNAEEKSVRPTIDLAAEEQLQQLTNQYQLGLIEESELRNGKYFDEEMVKLEKWADDKKTSLELQIKDIDKQIRLRKSEARHIQLLTEKVKTQREIKDLEKKRAELRQSYFTAQDEVDVKKEQLITNVESRLEQKVSLLPLFTIKFIIK
jgi:superfamily II DNA/RNA helicase